MKRETALNHEFVDYIPNELKDGTVYVCIAFVTVAHKCCCGCGNEVITPLSPTDWALTFDGQSISLYPSIGNWGFDCQSHYWIKHNRVKWAWQWSKEEIEAGRSQDRMAKKKYFDGKQEVEVEAANVETPQEKKPEENLWQRLKIWW